MLTQDFTVKLIEVNDRIGISANSNFKTKLFRGIMSLVVDNYFPPKNNQILPGNFFVIQKLKTHAKNNKTKKQISKIINKGSTTKKKTLKHSAKHFLKFD